MSMQYIDVTGKTEAEAIENAAVCGAVRIFEYGEGSNA